MTPKSWMFKSTALESLRLCMNITLRNWTVYKKDFVANISPTVADPTFIMISLGLGLGPFLTNIQGMSYMQFLAPGLAIATVLFTSFFETSWGFYVRMTFENVFKAMLTTPIGPNEVIIGELIWVGLKGAVMAICVGIVLMLFKLMVNPFLIPLLFLIGFIVAVPCGAIGLIATAMVRNINQFQTVYSFLIAPLYFMSGIFFPIDQMSPAVKFAAQLFPLIHGVRLSQAIFWNTGILEAFAINGSILILQSAVFCTFAYVKLKKKLIT